MPIILIHEGSLAAADATVLRILAEQVDVQIVSQLDVTPTAEQFIRARERLSVHDLKLREVTRWSRKESARHAAEVTRDQVEQSKCTPFRPRVYLRCNTKRRKCMIPLPRSGLPRSFSFYQGEH